MAKDTVRNVNKKSKACLTVDLQTDGRAVESGIMSIRDTAVSILQSDHPTKRQRKSLLSAAESLLELQKSIIDDIPTLVPNDCTKYAISRLHSTKSHEILTHSQKRPPRDNMRTRTFFCGSSVIPLPVNTMHYSAIEVCGILSQCGKTKACAKELP